jgi:two-component SAPR family response regulator
LIAVNLNHIKNDLKSAGITESVVYRGNRYFIHRDQIECDFELFEKAYKKFRLKKTKEYAKEIISLYKGEYLSDFEAFWAASKKIKYSEIYDEAKRFLS